MRFSQVLANFGFVKDHTIEHTVTGLQKTWVDEYNVEPERILTRVMNTLEAMEKQANGN